MSDDGDLGRAPLGKGGTDGSEGSSGGVLLGTGEAVVDAHGVGDAGEEGGAECAGSEVDVGDHWEAGGMVSLCKLP